VSERALSSIPEAGDPYATRTVLADGESVVFALRCSVQAGTAPGPAGYRLQPVGVQVVVTGQCLLTLHHEQFSLPSALAVELPDARSRAYVVYSVLDVLIASTFSALEEIELRLDDLAASSTDGRAGLPRAMLRDIVTTLATMRRWLTAEQALFERVGVEIAALPGFDRGDERYFDRLGQQVDRLLGSTDAVANGMGMLLDLQLNERAYVVSVLATIFVPLTLVTGYFGMNFGWLVERIDSPIAFWLLGIILPVTAGLLSWRVLVKPFLMGDGRQPRRR
jgi:magnesium transporter